MDKSGILFLQVSFVNPATVRVGGAPRGLLNTHLESHCGGNKIYNASPPQYCNQSVFYLTNPRYPMRSATNRVPSGVFTFNRTACFPCDLA
jgi:hypothetical protein